MRQLFPAVLIALIAAPSLFGQAPKPKKSNSVLKAAAKLADTAVSSVAAGAIDSVLGTAVAGGAGATCPAGMIATAAAPGMQGIAPAVAPTAGAAIVSAAKRKLTGAKKDPAAQAGVPQLICVPASAQAVDPSQLAASQAAAAQAAAQGQAGAPGVGSMAKGIVAATPVGMVATVATSEVGGKAVKAVAGLLGGKGPSKEGMIKELAKGRLVLKGVKFLPASDALEEGYEDDFEMLAEALAAMSGQFVLNVPAEAADKEEPDTAMARRRLLKISGFLQVHGVSQERIAVVGSYPPQLDPKKKSPKPGDVQVEVIRLPKDFKP
jgi:hypothetical protein